MDEPTLLATIILVPHMSSTTVSRPENKGLGFNQNLTWSTKEIGCPLDCECTLLLLLVDNILIVLLPFQSPNSQSIGVGWSSPAADRWFEVRIWEH